MDSPIDQTSAQMLYSLPVMRSGGGRNGKNVMTMQIARDFTHRHVFGGPCESTRTRAYELAGNAKVAKLDYALA